MEAAGTGGISGLLGCTIWERGDECSKKWGTGSVFKTTAARVVSVEEKKKLLLFLCYTLYNTRESLPLSNRFVSNILAPTTPIPLRNSFNVSTFLRVLSYFRYEQVALALQDDGSPDWQSEAAGNSGN